MTGEDAAVSDPDPQSRARSIALRRLEAAPRTRYELEVTLAQRDIPGDVAQGVLDRFEEVGLVNDESYAHEWVRSRHTGKGLSRRVLERELAQRGIDPTLAAEALDQVDDDSELQAAIDLVERKSRSITTDDPRKRTQRLLGVLARKGYSSQTAWQAIKSVDAPSKQYAPHDIEEE